MRATKSSRRARRPEIPPDPFNEHRLPQFTRRMRLLGGDFVFECGNAALMQLVDEAYKGVPSHTLSRTTPSFRVSLMPAPRDRPRSSSDPPRIEVLSGAGFLYGTTSSSSFAAVAPDYRHALVVVSREMLKFRYHTRYELIEFAVFTLASRAQGLLPLHAACVGAHGRGLLLLGDSGAGKSTASLHCLLRGLDFVSEDSVFITPDTQLITGVANFLHVQNDSLRFLPARQAAEIRRSSVIRRRSGVQKFEIDLRRRPYRLASSALKLASLIFLSPEPARQRGLLTPLGSRDALTRLQASQPFAASQAGWKVLERRLDRVPAFELRRGAHPLETADVLQRLLTL